MSLLISIIGKTNEIKKILQPNLNKNCPRACNEVGLVPCQTVLLR